MNGALRLELFKKKQPLGKASVQDKNIINFHMMSAEKILSVITVKRYVGLSAPTLTFATFEKP